MAVYEYTARDRQSKALVGAIEADNELTVAQKLREMGFVVTGLHRKAEPVTVEGLVARFRGVGLKELAVFSRQFATMIRGGLSLVRTLQVLEDQATHAILKGVIGKIRTDVEGGSPLSTALAKHPAHFSNLYVNMVRAGEAGGILDDVLLHLAEFLEKELALRQKVKSAMTYPILLACAALGALLFMTVVVIPQFATFFKELGGQVSLPLPTQIVLAISAAIRGFWWLGVLLGIGGVSLLRRFVRTPAGREGYDRLKLRLPVLAGIIKKIIVARFSRTFGTLVATGVPVLLALEVVARTTDNMVVFRAIEAVRTGVREGESIAIPLAATGIFPGMMVEMVKVGEETGSLEDMLSKVADFYDREVEATLNSLTSILEPVMIVVMGGVIGVLLLALYLPIFGLAMHVK